jgi:hypothetical protein
MITTNKVGGSIPGSKSMFVLQTINNNSASRWRYTNAPRNLPTHITSEKKCRLNLAEISSNWELNNNWVVQYNRDPRTRHYD